MKFYIKIKKQDIGLIRIRCVIKGIAKEELEDFINFPYKYFFKETKSTYIFKFNNNTKFMAFNKNRFIESSLIKCQECPNKKICEN